MSSRHAPMGIVVGIDDSPAARAAVRWAALDAELRKVPLTLVHAISPEVSSWLRTPMPAGVLRWQQDHGRRLVDGALKVVEEACRDGGPTAVNTEIMASGAVPTLIDLSKDAELVVTGAQGSGRWPGRLLGSVSSALLRHAHCPVAIIHDDEAATPPSARAPVLLGIDGSPASESATAIAFDEAARRGTGVVALHAWSDQDSEFSEIDWPATQSMAEEVLAERLAGWGEQYPDVRVSRSVVRAQPARQLVQRSDEAQLVVVGSRGRGGFAGMLVGSVGETVAQMARVPVIVAREPG
ncbi:universal stress protein [Mycobacterium parmense]|uniref:Universal stress protein n=1 Tax=Mycobacterium parmense TaxID=185642 RepID=A0A7I7YSF4_9MYCO|nr:universal stress protein [Mycobacterium parmense]MCV7351745.1 universal stress protein [Mycobacterium parmense]ORW60156.1 universal stress protein [Mycobacterium parmense]BBZ44788.1 universal stress protein [Mycobacterium parmense]